MVFQVNQERYNAAAARNSDVSHLVEASIGVNSAQLHESLGEANVLVGWTFPKKHLAQMAPNLRWIHIIGAGIEHLLPLNWLPPGVSLINNRGVHSEKAAEYMLMAILMLSNRIPALVTSQREGRWNEIFSSRLRGKTLVILGVGQMGGSAAKEAKRFGLDVIGIRRSGRPHRHVDEMYRPDQLHHILPRADILLVTTPLTKETNGLIGGRELDLLKPTAGLINLGRAKVVDYEALADRLEQGRLSGAILDVFDPEPLPTASRLWKTPNLIITPHVASDDWERYMPLTLDLVFENIRRDLQGRPLKNRVRPRLEY
jgi:phosphoglycerate dehydrogenase-like enzyme